VGFFAPLLAVRPDGTAEKLPPIELLREGVRAHFLRDGSGLVYLQGLPSAQSFWLLDLATLKSRELTRLNNAGAIRSFDISPDGNIVFDRLRGNSHIVLIDLPGDPATNAGQRGNNLPPAALRLVCFPTSCGAEKRDRLNPCLRPETCR
jgi:hypothetical protein